MKKAPLPQNEAARLAALKHYGILDTPSDAVLDSITQAAANLCETPIAMISLVDPTRQWFKSCIGLPVRETSRDLSFCSHAILEPSELMEVEDASHDERFIDNPLVTGEPNIRFYAGRPLVTLDGFALGTLCVIDEKPRRLSASQRDGLERLTNVIIELFHERRESRITAIDHISQQNVSDSILAKYQSKRLSETKQEWEQILATRNRLAQIVEDSVNEIYVSDADSFRILNANRTARENLGYSVNESKQLMPWNFVEGLTQDDVYELTAPLRAGVLKAQIFEAVHTRKDGTTYPVSIHLQYMGTQDPPVFTAIVQDITERQRQEESVRLRERAIEALDVGVTIIDATKENNPLVYVNQTLCTMTGYSAVDLIGQGAGILQKNNHQQLQHLQIKAAQAKGVSVQVLFKSTRKDGSQFMNDLSLSPVHSAEGKLTHYIGINRDVTAKLETEERSQRSQKIQAIGQLAGGIAHDFNNLLSVITGNLEFLAMDITNKDHLNYLDKADSAAKMGARLTRRLLSFAKQGQLEPMIISANEHVLAAIELLRSTIGEHITLSSKLSNDLWSIRADSSEIENTVVNLIINARDAMPKGGKITIETKNVTFIKEDTDEAFGILPGDYIQLSVSDTGSGMDDEVKARVFEPFFTTKEASSGLGLASIYGFAQQSGGDVHVYSELDHGTVISVYLPKNIGQVVSTTDANLVVSHPTKEAGRILVVEDNDMVRELTVERLHALGYDTVQAINGPEAVQILKDDAAFDLILTDIVMEGGMSGLDVAQWVQINRPSCKILLTSGFNEQMAEAIEVNIDKLRVLQKPYSLAELQQRINVVLERTRH